MANFTGRSGRIEFGATSDMNDRCINDWTTYPIICTLMSLSGVRGADIMRALAWVGR